MEFRLVLAASLHTLEKQERGTAMEAASNARRITFYFSEAH
jgi:hypothetical protein